MVDCPWGTFRSPGALWSLCSHSAELVGWGGGHSRNELAREKKTRETRDWRGGRKLATNICCRSVPSLAGSGNPHIRCTAAAVSTQALSNTYTMALLSQTKLERWLWKETGSPQSQHCQDRVAEHSLIKHMLEKNKRRIVPNKARRLWLLLMLVNIQNTVTYCDTSSESFTGS